MSFHFWLSFLLSFLPFLPPSLTLAHPPIHPLLFWSLRYGSKINTCRGWWWQQQKWCYDLKCIKSLLGIQVLRFMNTLLLKPFNHPTKIPPAPPTFTDEETEDPRDEGMCQGHHVTKVWNRASELRQRWISQGFCFSGAQSNKEKSI